MFRWGVMNSESSNIAIGPILQAHVESFKSVLNIVEVPDVGALALPPAICKLVDMTLKTMLEASVDRESTRVRVTCVIDDSRCLHLEVTDDAPFHDMPSQFRLSVCGERAAMVDGSIGIRHETGGETTVSLDVPLPPN